MIDINKRRIKNRNSYYKHHEERKRRAREIYHQDKDKYRNKQYKKLYQITIEDYNNMLHDQNGVCDICKQRPQNKKLFVDHDHNTKRVRGLLCSKCNAGLGQFKDSIENLMSAIAYIEGNNIAASLERGDQNV